MNSTWHNYHLCIIASLTWLTFTSFGQTFPWQAFTIDRLALQADGKVLISGRFERINGVPRTNLARLNLDGSLDPSFVPAAGMAGSVAQTISWVGVQPDGKILITGWSSNGIVRLEPDGKTDPSFQPPVLVFGGLVGVKGGAIQNDGSILIFGQFSGIAGEVRDGIARLDSHGILDRSFNPRLMGKGLFSRPQVLTIQRDGKILLAGYFDTVNGTPRSSGLARLNPDGTLDPTFDPTAGTFSVLAVTPGGKVYGNHLLGVTRLNADGSSDSQFNPGFGIGADLLTGVHAVALQTDERLLIGGNFQSYDGLPRAGLARILPDGSLDAGFDAKLNLSPRVHTPGGRQLVRVWAIALQTDGRMIIAGEFTGVREISRSWIARLDADGKPDEIFHAFRPIILTSAVNADRFFTLKIAGEVGRPYRVEESGDLINWEPLRNFLILGESFQFVDVRHPVLPRVFYRIFSD